MAPVSMIVVVLSSGNGIPQFVRDAIAGFEASEDFNKHHNSRRVTIPGINEPHLLLASIFLERDRDNLVNNILGTMDLVAPQASICKPMAYCKKDFNDRFVSRFNQLLYQFRSATHVLDSGEVYETNWCFELQLSYSFSLRSPFHHYHYQ